MGTLHCAVGNGADLYIIYVNERQKVRHYRARSNKERRRRIIESVEVGMSKILYRRNTLQTLEYLALGTLACILNTTIVFYG